MSKDSLVTIKASRKAARTFNPIRSIVDTLKPPKGHPKKMLNMVGAITFPSVNAVLCRNDISLI